MARRATDHNNSLEISNLTNADSIDEDGPSSHRSGAWSEISDVSHQSNMTPQRGQGAGRDAGPDSAARAPAAAAADPRMMDQFLAMSIGIDQGSYAAPAAAPARGREPERVERIERAAPAAKPAAAPAQKKDEAHAQFLAMSLGQQTEAPAPTRSNSYVTDSARAATPADKTRPGTAPTATVDLNGPLPVDLAGAYRAQQEMILKLQEELQASKAELTQMHKHAQRALQGKHHDVDQYYRERHGAERRARLKAEKERDEARAMAEAGKTSLRDLIYELNQLPDLARQLGAVRGVPLNKNQRASN